MANVIRRILLVEDDDQYATMVARLLSSANFEVVRAAGAMEALRLLEQEEKFDLILSDILMPGMSGLDMLDRLNDISGVPPVIVMSAYGTVDTAIQAIKKGAYDYVSKPASRDELVLAIRKLEERETLRRRIISLEEHIKQNESFSDIIGRSEKMREVFSLIRKVAPFRTTVLITGESGTGKELVARAIHQNSPRKDGPFTALNCGAIPERLLESELFGHVRGAFTDAYTDKKGLFEESHSGTLFLDEIGELPMPLQVKLLRTLQDGEIRRVGATKSTIVDVRVVAASAKDLLAEVKAGRFREDLFYRLNVVQVNLPPLRERLADIEPLVRHFIEKTNRRLSTSIKGVDQRAMKALMAWSWPGNVRELENVIERATVLAEGGLITWENLPEHIRLARMQSQPRDPDDLSIKKAVRAIEEDLIRRALFKTGGNRTQAARLLGISHRALLYKIRDYDILIPPAKWSYREKNLQSGPVSPSSD